jgi:hypothetical protein
LNVNLWLQLLPRPGSDLSHASRRDCAAWWLDATPSILLGQSASTDRLFTPPLIGKSARKGQRNT